MIASCREPPASRVLGSERRENGVRELILKMSMSVDGFVSDLSGRNEWMFGADEAAKAWSVEATWNASLHIMGGRSFQAMAPFWPTSKMPFAPPMNQIPKAVFSKQGPAILKAATATQGGAHAESWAQAYVAGGDLAEEIASLKAQDGKPILAHGGVSFARSLIAQGLVDQFIVAVHPVALGNGLPLFCDLAAPMPLRLVSSKAFPGGAVGQVYRPA
jgi:dihydrofolate reductase